MHAVSIAYSTFSIKMEIRKKEKTVDHVKLILNLGHFKKLIKKIFVGINIK